MYGLLLLNKPKGITSHDLVVKARTALGISKIGHTGTLDPLAEGLMILTVGKATKLLPYIVDYSKEYVATLSLGFETDSDDITGNILKQKDVVYPSESEIKDALKSFLGDSYQLPPMYSAKKVNGQKLYELARKNVEIEREEVLINISNIELLEYIENNIRFKVNCSSGTYVRVICKDLAKKLNNYGCMSALKRTKINNFSLENSFTIDQLERGEFQLINPIDIMTNYKMVNLDELTDVYNGKKIRLNCTEEIVFITHNHDLIAVYELDNDGYYHCRRGLW